MTDEDGQPEDVRRIDEVVERGRLARDLLDAMREALKEGEAGRAKLHPVIIEFNNFYPGGAREARARVVGDYLAERENDSESYAPGPERELLVTAMMAGKSRPIEELKFQPEDRLFIRKSAFTDHYVFGELTTATLETVARMQAKLEEKYQALIYKVWLDRDCQAFIDTSFRTIKCDAGQTAFGADGRDIVWAVMDTGIQGHHPHFAAHETLKLPGDLNHRDFTGEDFSSEESSVRALIDDDGHGTHVAGIIAGETLRGPAEGKRPKVDKIVAAIRQRIDDQRTDTTERHLDRIAGIAPRAKLVSLKVLSDRRTGKVSMLIAALGYVQRINEYGRNLQIHGVNLSLGYAFDPEWFAAGHSPLCKEVDRLVRSGVVVVAAAGNGGYGAVTTHKGYSEKAAHASTIADPGNAELAITVGSTHRDRPHEYGVSYFSAKGPTADGRNKPDLVAPGERIISCALRPKDAPAELAFFKEDTGTSMAAPHVSAAIAAFLSVRREFIGKPETVKRLFTAQATDLGRRREFQGAGLIDLMRTLQAV